MLACVAVALGFGGFVGTASAAAPPPNDLIGGATVVSALPFSATVDTTGATTDANDMQVNLTCGAPVTNNSVWYTFTAGPSDTLLAVDTTGSTFSSGVIIATGTPGALTTRACGPISAKVAVASGTTYYIMAFDDSGSGGTLHISMHGAGPPPANDTIGHSTVSRVQDARNAGVNEFLAKPLTARGVVERLAQVIDHPRAFVKAGEYFGPDRRRRADPAFEGPFRRGADAPERKAASGEA